MEANKKRRRFKLFFESSIIKFSSNITLLKHYASLNIESNRERERERDRNVINLTILP